MGGCGNNESTRRLLLSYQMKKYTVKILIKFEFFIKKLRVFIYLYLRVFIYLYLRVFIYLYLRVFIYLYLRVFVYLYLRVIIYLYHSYNEMYSR